MSSPERPWDTGRIIGPYLLLAPLAQGGMAEIWLARRSGLKGFEKLVVIKRMTGALQSDPEFVEMFLFEARLAAQLSHPNVVQVYDLGEEAGSFYIAMEYLDGENLSTIRRVGQRLGHPLPDHLSARLIARAAEGLHYAHTRVGLDGRPLNVIHRDVSPQNLIVTFEGTLKIVDFGIAKAATHHTNSRGLKGKLAYMAPEQARGLPVDARSDVFSLGIVLFELVTHTRLLPKLADFELLAVMAGDAPLPKPLERRADVPPGLDAIITKAMAREPEERFQSALEMHGALEEWLRQAGQSASNTDVGDYLRGVFASRIEERRLLVEAAMKAEPTRQSTDNIRILAQKAAISESSNTSARAAGSRKLTHSRSRWMVVASAVLVLVIWTAVVARMRAEAKAAEEAVRAATLQPPPPPPPPPPEEPLPTLVIETTPANAAVEVDGAQKGVAPLTLAELTLGDHRVVASLPGYKTEARAVKLERRGDRVVLPLTLLPLPPPTPPRKGASDRGRSKTAGPTGNLKLQTTPWTTVYEGKTRLGDTPLLGIPLPAGKHVLRLVNPEKGVETSVEITIEPNKTLNKSLHL